MLNVPEEVKELFKQDGVRKNFRVHFPNGEHEDLINADIESESVKFTESMQSGEDFRYGLIEGNSLEFRAHNIDYVTGCTIEASLEVDTSTLDNTTYRSSTYSITDAQSAVISTGFNYIKNIVMISDIYTPYDENVQPTITLRFDNNGDFRNIKLKPTLSIWHPIDPDDNDEVPLIDIDNDDNEITNDSEDNGYIELTDDDITDEDIDIQIDSTFEINYYGKLWNISYDSAGCGITTLRVYYTYSTYPLEYKDDIGYNVVSIPYGTFIIDSCKKDVQNNVRDIIAYQNKWTGDNSAIFKLSEVEKFKMMFDMGTSSALHPNVDKYIFNPYTFLAANSNFIPNDYQTDYPNRHHLSGSSFNSIFTSKREETYTYGGYRLQRNFGAIMISDVTDIQWWQYTWAMTGETSKLEDIFGIDDFLYFDFENYTDTNRYDRNEFMRFDIPFAYTQEELQRRIVEDFGEFPIILNSNYGSGESFSGKSISKFDAYSNISVTMLRGNDSRTTIRSKGTTTVIRDRYKQSDSATDIIIYEKDHVQADNMYSCFLYPYLQGYYTTPENAQSELTTRHYAMYVVFTHDITITNTRTGYSKTYDLFKVQKGSIFEDEYDIPFYIYECDTSFLVELDRNTYQKENTTYKSASNLVDTLNVSNIANALVELDHKCLKMDRTNNLIVSFEPFGSHGLYPATDLYPSTTLYPRGASELITRNLIKSVWWDDVFVKYLKVSSLYKYDNQQLYMEYNIQTDDDDNVEYQIYQKDDKIYDLSDNYIIQHSNTNEEGIETLLQNIAEAVKNVYYLKSNITMKGLPYLEVGDVISVMTQDSGFETCIFRRTLTGIQSLTDTIEVQ